jgi:predicted Rossmann-fold nucleotide-binding protein
LLRRLPIVGVFGRGSDIDAGEAVRARSVGAMVARLGAHLLTGGGFGVMEAAAQGFTAVEPRAGFSIGAIPRQASGGFDEPNRDMHGRPYPNAFVEIPIFTPLPPREIRWQSTPARNHVNVLSADAIVGLPGGVGTHNELDMAAHYRDEAARPRNGRRTVLVGPHAAFSPEHREQFVRVDDANAAEHHLRRVLARQGFAIAAEVLA